MLRRLNRDTRGRPGPGYARLDVTVARAPDEYTSRSVIRRLRAVRPKCAVRCWRRSTRPTDAGERENAIKPLTPLVSRSSATCCSVWSTRIRRHTRSRNGCSTIQRRARAPELAGPALAMARAVFEEWRLAHTLRDFKLWLEQGAPSDDASR